MLEALGLPMVTPEPEVAQATIARVQCKSLARIITDLIADHEPLLKAECDGATVTVRERGGPGVMRFTVEAAKQGERP
jgi:hypothetical protein